VTAKFQLYICEKHAGLHAVENGSHNIISLTVKPSTKKTQYVFENFSKVLKILSEIRLKVFKISKQVIQPLYENQMKALKEI
jgi:hypothetical protein